jgi:peptidoglycan/xylan/chitin deacetylase (PgdA/CDA1 family)
MAVSGLIDFGAHGYSHAILSLLSPAEQEDEILRSLHAVRELTGQPCRFFAYPNGRRQDYNEETVRILDSHGVQAAVTTMSGFNDERTSLMELGRYEYSARRGKVLLPLHAWSARIRHAVQGRLA